METIYREKQKTYLIVVSIYIIVALFLLSLIFLPQFFNFSQASLLTRIILIIITVVDLILFWSFAELKVKLTFDTLEFGFGVFRKKMSLKEIQNCSVEDFDIKRYSGYGIRLGRDKSIGYIARGGRGVRLKTLNRDYFISSDSPEQLGNELRKAI